MEPEFYYRANKSLLLDPDFSHLNPVHSVWSMSLIKMTVFWNTAPCSLVEVYRRFWGAYCLHHQSDE
jgi:hypothetical protein